MLEAAREQRRRKRHLAYDNFFIFYFRKCFTLKSNDN